jgi:hypothetical protein
MKNEGRMRGGENPTKLKQPLPEVRSRVSKNQGIHFILHFSFFIPLTH